MTHENMVAQKLISLTGVVVFLTVAGRMVFSIPQHGVFLGVGMVFLIFLIWYFVLCHNFFRGGAVNFLNKFAPLVFVSMFFVLILLGLLKIFPWMPGGGGEVDSGRVEESLPNRGL